MVFSHGDAVLKRQQLRTREGTARIQLSTTHYKMSLTVDIPLKPASTRLRRPSRTGKWP